MKWILCGKNDAAVEVLEILLDHGDDVWVIGTAGDDGTDAWQRSLVGAAARAGVRCEQPSMSCGGQGKTPTIATALPTTRDSPPSRSRGCCSCGPTEYRSITPQRPIKINR